MTEKKTTAKRERPKAKKKEPEVEVKEALKEPKANIIHIPVSPDASMALSKNVEDQYRLIAMPTPKKFIKKRQGRGNMEYDFVEANYVQLRLNAIFHFDWDFDVIEWKIDSDQDMIALLGKLTVRFSDGRIVHKTAWGGSDLKYLTKWDEHTRQKIKTDRLLDLGADLKSAGSDSLKKCASMLGICWDVYAGYGQQKIAEPTIEEEIVEEKPVEAQEEAEPSEEVIEGEIVPPVPSESVEEGIEDEPEPPFEQEPEPKGSEPISEEEGKEIVASEERQGIKDFIRHQLEALYGKRGIEDAYKSLKLFLFEWQETKLNDEGKPRMFVQMNQFNNISLLLGRLEDLRMLKLHFKYILSEWKKWANETTKVPF